MALSGVALFIQVGVGAGEMSDDVVRVFQPLELVGER
jgi:hypothetical protein